ncbi:hypothetical protein AB205_0037830 [Aquarana catesbeiana]|uniref:Uncharacterized protein n=1 Tax=Aquarana catesbeiana TaxID=8400 RepID=A0A2G9S2I2_AQUCT|nr:hypothetical protein AB205_0037830 [Aquarana catesbeiana]
MLGHTRGPLNQANWPPLLQGLLLLLWVFSASYIFIAFESFLLFLYLAYIKNFHHS